MRRAFAFQLYTSKHLRYLHVQIDLAAEIYNHLLALQKRYYRRYKGYIGYFRLKRHLTKLKRQVRFAHWCTLGSQALQNIVWRIDQGYQKFFRKENKRPPTFRKRHKYHSITLAQAGWKYHGGNRLTIAGKLYRFHASRPIEGAIKTLTIKRMPTGRMMVIFSCTCDLAPLARIPVGHEAGFDFGLQQFLTGSTGEDVKTSQPLRTALRQVRKANRVLSRKQKGSRHRRQARRALARLHRTIANRRNAWHWETARALCTRYDTIYLEDLDLRGMQAMWGRKVSDLGYSGFVSILHHTAQKMGTHVHHIDRFFPSTKLCHVCGTINEHITLRDRVWTCTSCGTVHHRDRNAAINIHREGASSPRQGHRKTSSGAVPT
jgi:putative transposase